MCVVSKHALELSIILVLHCFSSFISLTFLLLLLLRAFSAFVVVAAARKEDAGATAGARDALETKDNIYRSHMGKKGEEGPTPPSPSALAKLLIISTLLKQFSNLLSKCSKTMK